MSVCFVDQIATQEILLRVTNVCGECYGDLEVGDAIYYDLQSYRYLCSECHERISENIDDECVLSEEEGLFG